MPPSPDGSIKIIRNVDVDVDNVLNGLTVQILNNNDIDYRTSWTSPLSTTCSSSWWTFSNPR